MLRTQLLVAPKIVDCPDIIILEEELVHFGYLLAVCFGGFLRSVRIKRAVAVGEDLILRNFVFEVSLGNYEY
jgi:hypothetical protein